MSCETHCCKRHGCKYGYDKYPVFGFNCPVYEGKSSGVRCELCEYDPEPDPRLVVYAIRDKDSGNYLGTKWWSGVSKGKPAFYSRKTDAERRVKRYQSVPSRYSKLEVVKFELKEVK